MQTSLPTRYEPLLQYMTDVGYSPATVKNVYKEAIRFTIRGKSPSEKNYQHLIDSLRFNSSRHALKIVRDFDIYGKLPVPYKRRSPSKERYESFPNEFKLIYDRFYEEAKAEGIVSKTAKCRLCILSSFLWTCYSIFHRCRIAEITESDIRYYFTSGKRGDSVYKSLKAALKTCRTIVKASDIDHIMSLLPSYPTTVKQPQILSDKEINAIYNEVCNENSQLSLRNRAIIALCLSTALRSGDIVSLELSNIQWDTNEIKILQSKTNKWVRVPLRPFAGNLIFRYITEERPNMPSSKIFLIDDSWPRPMKSRHLYSISLKLFKILGIRQNSERKGLHIFRHTLASRLIREGTDISVVSNILGHSNPDTINQYLAVDTDRMRSFAIDISCYPIDNEYFR